MAHAKAVNRKKNNEDDYDSPHHTPITGDRREDYEDSPIPPPKKKKKIKPPTSLNSSINDENAEESGTSGSSGKDSNELLMYTPSYILLHPKSCKMSRDYYLQFPNQTVVRFFPQIVIFRIF